MGTRDLVSLRVSSSKIFSTLGLLLALLLGAACGDDPAEPVELEVRPGRLDLVKGRSGTAAAMNHGESAGSAVSWRSANPAIAMVSEAADGSAMITGTGVGQTEVIATLRDGSATLVVAVGDPVVESIALTPPAPSLAAGTSVALAATAMLSDKTTRDVTSQVVWSSSDTAKVTVNAAGGVRGVVKGAATVRATLGALQATAAINVTDAVLTTIQVGPTAPSLAKGLTQQMTATGVFSDGTNQNLTAMATWTTSAAAAATVSATGLVTAVDPGNATITAMVGTRSGSTTVTVTAAALRSIAIAPAAPSVAKGLTVQLSATGTYTDNSTQDLSDTVTWTSGTTTVATMAGRVATGVNTGTSTITAAMSGINGTATLTVTPALLVSLAVTPANAQIPNGSTRQYTAMGTFTDASQQNLTTQVTWTTGDAAVLSISNAAGSNGLATALALGTTTVTATMGAISGQTNAEVINVTLVSIAVTGASAGDLPVGRTRQLTATGTYNDNSTVDLTTQVTWTSSNDALATVSNIDGSRGLVTAVAMGAVTITATMGTVTGTIDINVVAPVIDTITIAPATVNLFSGDQQQLTATARFSDNTNVDVTNTALWSSLNVTVASVGLTGMVTAMDMGTATINAAQGGVVGSATVNVKVINTITVGVTDVAWGTSKQLVATATYADASTEDVTQLASWASGDTAALTITNTGTRGVATALSTAGATATATLRGVSGNAAIAGCKMLVNEVQVAGATAANEWIEIASTCGSAQNLTGLRLVYRPAAGTSDTALLDLTGTFASGGHNFYVSNQVIALYPTASGSFTTGSTGQLAGAGGGIGLRYVAGGVIVDSVGYGTATNAFVETAVIAAPAASSSVARMPDATDNNNNSTDFQVRTTPTPGVANN